MTLLDLHVELAQTNVLLARIADALDRAFPVPCLPGANFHPLVGIADVSRMTPARAADLSKRREEEQVARSVHFASESAAGGASGHSAAQAETSVTGLWDFDDILDPDLESEHQNYPGV